MLTKRFGGHKNNLAKLNLCWTQSKMSTPTYSTKRERESLKYPFHYCSRHFHLFAQDMSLECGVRFLSLNLLLPIMAHKFDRKLFQLFRLRASSCDCDSSLTLPLTRSIALLFYGFCVVVSRVSFKWRLKEPSRSTDAPTLLLKTKLLVPSLKVPLCCLIYETFCSWKSCLCKEFVIITWTLQLKLILRGFVKKFVCRNCKIGSNSVFVILFVFKYSCDQVLYSDIFEKLIQKYF